MVCNHAMLHESGLRMEAKAFAVGVRIEHAQAFIDRMQYGAAAGSPQLPVADFGDEPSYLMHG